jgi:molecular chaperone DnaK (HSP70)
VATDSGIPKVHLINDSMAAIIAHTHGRDLASTIMVYGMGYGGYEIGLIRVAKKHFRTLAYSGGCSPAGALFDAAIMHSCFHGLKNAGRWSPSRSLSAQGWLNLRSWAQRLKQDLSSNSTVVQLLGIEEAGLEGMLISVLASSYERTISPQLETTLVGVEQVLQEANMSPKEVDELLMLGGSTRIPILREMLANHFSRAPIMLDDRAIVRGAAIYASQLGLNSGLPANEIVRVTADDEASHSAISSLPPLKIPLSFEAPAGIKETSPKHESGETNGTKAAKPLIRIPATQEGSSAEKAAPASKDGPRTLGLLELGLTHRQNLFEYAQQLVDQGYHERAIGYLQSIAQDVQELLQTLVTRNSPLLSSEVEATLRTSYELLAQGRYQQAVEESHRAHALDSETPSVFQQMIDIHCAAAMSNNSSEGYAKAMEWLRCVYHLDRTNQAIHSQIAERNFIHALQMKHEKQEALSALEECLFFNPAHQEALKLQQLLTTET